jgi:glycine dehydrogenase subunit 1
VLATLRAEGILGGYDLGSDYPGSDYPGLGNALLICATETRSDADLDAYAAALARALKA